jgi:hypothetical protein
MTILASLILLFTLPGAPVSSPVRMPVDRRVEQQARKGGQWYFAESGHAVFCYGPVMVVTHPQGGLQRVATFCQGDQTLVPLKD